MRPCNTCYAFGAQSDTGATEGLFRDSAVVMDVDATEGLSGSSAATNTDAGVTRHMYSFH